MNMQTPNQTKPNDGPQTPQPRISWFWWILLICLMIWNVITYLNVASPQVEIPYSTFLDQVKAGNVSTVTITGNEITGAFVKPLAWPSVMPGATSNDSAPATADQQSYSEFDTLFPDSVGDPKLLRLLEQKHIEIQVQNVSTPWYVTLLTDGLPLLLLVLVSVWMGRQARKSQQGIMSFRETRARQVLADQPKITFEDVAGADEA